MNLPPLRSTPAYTFGEITPATYVVVEVRPGLYHVRSDEFRGSVAVEATSPTEAVIRPGRHLGTRTAARVRVCVKRALRRAILDRRLSQARRDRQAGMVPA